MRPQSATCSCSAYAWPHRLGGGQCIWSKKHAEFFCEECGQVCSPRLRKDSDDNGSWEYFTSSCCDAPVILSGHIYLPEDEEKPCVLQQKSV